MDVTADALDAGLLRYSDGAVIGTGGFVETSNQRLDVRHVLPIVRPGGPGQGADRPAGTAARCASSDVANVVEDHQPLWR